MKRGVYMLARNLSVMIILEGYLVAKTRTKISSNKKLAPIINCSSVLGNLYLHIPCKINRKTPTALI